MTVYVATCVVNGKQYVGKTQRSLALRWKQHLSVAMRGSKQLFHCAIRKYGTEAFTVACLARFDKSEELDLAEQLFIAGLNTKSPNGYNLTDGGGGTSGYVVAEHVKRAVALANTRRPVTPAVRAHLSAIGSIGRELQRGRKRPAYIGEAVAAANRRRKRLKSPEVA